MSQTPYSYRSVDQTFPQYLWALTIIHAAMGIGQLLFGLVSVFLNNTDESATQPLPVSETTLQFLIPTLLLIGFVAGRLLFKNKLNSLKESDDLDLKLKTFRSASILKYALAEVPILISILTYLFTHSILFLGLGGLGLITFMLDRPTKYGIIDGLALSQKEIASIENPELIIVKGSN
jgi:hypothetical protein